jgi:hypothetical protein
MDSWFGISAQKGADLLPKNPTITATEVCQFPEIPGISTAGNFR